MRFEIHAASLLLAALTTETSAQAKSTAFFDARIETMTDRGLINRGFVIVADGKIATVSTGNLPKSFRGVRINAHGYTLMPGL